MDETLIASIAATCAGLAGVLVSTGSVGWAAGAAIQGQRRFAGRRAPLVALGGGILAAALATMALVAWLDLATWLFAVPFAWGRMAAISAVLAAVAVGGEVALPTAGADGLVLRCLAIALIPLLLLPLSTRAERDLVRRVVRRG